MGTSDKLTQAEFPETLKFLIKAFHLKIVDAGKDGALGGAKSGGLTEDDLEALSALRSQHGSAVLNIDSFTTDLVEGCVPKLERGSLTLVLV
jgi:hypothetical protein